MDLFQQAPVQHNKLNIFKSMLYSFFAIQKHKKNNFLEAKKAMKHKRFKITAQMALEYLVTYGWALIVIATVIGALVFVASEPASTGVCKSSSSQLVVRDWVFEPWDDGVEFVLQNASGLEIGLESDCISETDGVDIHEDRGFVTTCSPTTVRKSDTFVVRNLDSDASGSFKGAMAALEYTDGFGLPRTVTITCSGKVPLSGCAGLDCTDENPCTVDSCSDGQCSNDPLPDGSNCGTGMECQSGQCVSTGNQAPTAVAGDDQTISEGEEVTLDGSASFDPDGTIEAYEWKEGETVLSDQASFTKSDFAVGEHTITLTVTDNEGATGTDTVIVTVEAVAGLCGTKVYDQWLTEEYASLDLGGTDISVSAGGGNVYITSESGGWTKVYDQWLTEEYASLDLGGTGISRTSNVYITRNSC